MGRKHPGFPDQIGKLDAAPACPWTVRAGDRDKRLLEQRFRNQIILDKGFRQPPDQKFDLALAQRIELRQRDVGMDHPQLDAADAAAAGAPRSPA